jgi:hypothetical protein
VLPLDVWDILVAEQLSFDWWHIAAQSGSFPDLKSEDYDHGIPAPFGLDSVYRKVYMFKLVYMFELVYSSKVVYRLR